MPLDLEKLKTELVNYIDPYITATNKEAHTASGFAGNLAAKFLASGSSEENNRQCEMFKRDIQQLKSDNAAEKLIQLAKELGREGRNTQLKTKKSHSRFSETCFFLNQLVLHRIKESKDTVLEAKIRAECTALRKRVEEKKQALRTATQANNGDLAKGLQKERDEAILDLVFLGDNYYLEDKAEIQKLFPPDVQSPIPLMSMLGLKAPYAEAGFKYPEENETKFPGTAFAVNSQFPYVLQPHFVDIYLVRQAKLLQAEPRKLDEGCKQVPETTLSTAAGNSTAPLSTKSDSDDEPELVESGDKSNSASPGADAKHPVPTGGATNTGASAGTPVAPPAASSTSNAASRTGGAANGGASPSPSAAPPVAGATRPSTSSAPTASTNGNAMFSSGNKDGQDSDKNNKKDNKKGAGKTGGKGKDKNKKDGNVDTPAATADANSTATLTPKPT